MRTPERTRTIVKDAPSLFDVGRFEEAGLKVLQRRYEPSQTIFMAGDPADRLHLLVEGMVRVCKTYGNYSRATVALLKDSGGFGEFDLFGKDSQSATAQAMTGCRVASIRKSDLRYAMERHPGLAVELFSLFSERLRHSEQTMEVLLHREVSSRLASLMPVLEETFATHEIAGGELTIPLTHGEVAEMIACTREAVSKVLSELKIQGFIELGQRKITIKDHAGLRARITGSGSAFVPRELSPEESQSYRRVLTGLQKV